MVDYTWELLLEMKMVYVDELIIWWSLSLRFVWSWRRWWSSIYTTLRSICSHNTNKRQRLIILTSCWKTPVDWLVPRCYTCMADIKGYKVAILVSGRCAALILISKNKGTREIMQNHWLLAGSSCCMVLAYIGYLSSNQIYWGLKAAESRYLFPLLIEPQYSTDIIIIS